MTNDEQGVSHDDRVRPQQVLNVQIPLPQETLIGARPMVSETLEPIKFVKSKGLSIDWVSVVASWLLSFLTTILVLTVLIMIAGKK